MVTLSMRMSADESNKGRFMDTVRGMLQPIRVEPGCVECRLWEDFEDTSSLILLQKWEDGSAFRRHIRQHNFRTLLVALDLLNRAPSIDVTRDQDRVELTSISDLYENTWPD